MILILGGTVDARRLAEAIQQAGYPLLLSTVSDYAAAIAGGLPVRSGALDKTSLTELVRKAQLVIDATHPFATVISQMAMEICAKEAVPYLRYERSESTLPSSVILVDNEADAAAQAVALAAGGTILLTVGSKTLATYLSAARVAGCRVVARVLPTVSVLSHCAELGLPTGDIIAMQGPTSAELDAALIRHYDARVLVTKESGDVGGVMEKVQAAEMTGIPVVVVRRPRLTYPRCAQGIADVLAFIKE